MKIDQDFTIKKLEHPEKDEEIFYYDQNGIRTNQVNSACLKETKIGLQRIYQAKVNKHNRLFNPNESSLNEDDKVTKTLRFRFQEVSENTFHTYLTFLKTRQESYLSMAERQMR